MTLQNDSFAVREVTFQEQVDIADEDYGDALDSLDLDGSARPDSGAAHRPPDSTEDTHIDSMPRAESTPRRGVFARLFGWILGR